MNCFVSIGPFQLAYFSWLLEQGSNLQALRHLINSQARLPIPPSRNIARERTGANAVCSLSPPRPARSDVGNPRSAEPGVTRARTGRGSKLAVDQPGVCNSLRPADRFGIRYL